MQENNFEKAVRQELDALRLAPSEPVWQHIEATLKKKKDRRFIFWLLPVFLLSGAILWWHAATKVPALQANQPNTTGTESKPTFSKPHTTQPSVKIDAGHHPTPPVHTTKTTKNNRFNQTNNFTKIAISTARNKRKEPAISQTPVTFSNSHATLVTDTSLANSDFKNKFPAKVSDKTNQQQFLKSDSIQKKDTAAVVLQQPKPAHRDSLMALIKPVNKQSKQKHKQEWRLVARAGSSNIVEGLNSLFSGFRTSKSLQDPASPSSYTTGYVYYNASGAGNAVGQPAAPAKGLQFTVGGLLKKAAGRRSSVQTGLQYGFYSNHLVVGTNLPAGPSSGGGNNLVSSRTVYQNNGARYRFTNTSHFIEVPVLFDYAVLKKRPLHLQQGIVVSQLVRSNVLQYDNFTNTYYKRTSGLQKTMLQVVAGLDYTFYKNKAFSLQAGPQVQWSLQPVFKNKAAKSNLASGGIALHMSFWKRSCNGN